MHGTGSPYEVRCLRCDVSFPLGTRRCIHCGGPTSSSGASYGASSGAFAGLGTTMPGPFAPASGTSPAPIGVETDGPFPWSRPRDSEALPSSRPASRPAPGSGIPGAELPEPDEAPQTTGAKLLRSLGSLIWIVALIGFSIVRSCSEG